VRSMRNGGVTGLTCAIMGIACLAEGSRSLGANATPATTATTAAGDAIKPGDHITIQADANIFYAADDPKGSAATPFCVPAESRFEVNVVEAKTTATAAPPSTGAGAPKPNIVSSTTTGNTTSTEVNGAGTVSQTADSILHVTFPERPSPHNALFWISPVSWYRFISPDIKDGDANATCAKSGTKLVPGAYQVSATALQNYGIYRKGFTWGAMVVPYKFETHDHSFQPAPSVLGYFGFEGWWSGLSLANIVALGGGAASSSVTSAGTGTGTTGAGTGSTSPTTSTSTKPTYTAALGEIATFGGNFKVGLLVGIDWQGSGSGFRYEGKPWFAISVGF
jgi:uncharacterized protein YaiE (UPF0345 family)